MKKIQNTAPPMMMSTQRSPLTVKLSVKAAAGRLTQAQDSALGLWNPDRTISPLILEPVFTAYDADKGVTVNANPVFVWYVGSVSNANKITSVTTSDNYYLETSSNTQTGRLVVRKNVDYDDPVEIICVAKYTDNLHGDELTEQENVILTTSNSPEEFYAVNIGDNSTIVFSPLTADSSQKDISALVNRGTVVMAWDNLVGKAVGAVDMGTLTWSYSSSVFQANLPSTALTTGGAAAAGYTQDQSLSSNNTISTSTSGKIRVKNSTFTSAADFKKAMGGRILFYELATKTVNTAFADAMAQLTTFFWYCDETLIATDGTFPGYVSGQGSETLTVDLDFISQKVISVRLGVPEIIDNAGVKTVTLPLSSNAPATDSVLIAWEFDGLDALPLARGADAVKEQSRNKIFDAIVRKNNLDVSDEKVSEYIRLNWKSHSTDANYGTQTDHGWGPTTVIPASTLIKTGNTNVEVTTDIYTLGELDILVDDNDVAITDDSGSATQSDYGGYVVGRT